MRKKLLSKLMLLLCALLVGSTSAWADAVTLTAGTNGSACTVNNNDGIKIGTSSKGGDMTITVPAYTTKLTLHAAAWKGVTGLSLNISGATVSPENISLTADDGISGNSPFTLSGNESDFVFELSLSNVTTETILTFETSTTKRCVVWGASATVSSGGGGDTELADNDLALTDAPIALTFDLYNNATAQTIHYTTSSTGEVSVEAGQYDVSCYVDNDAKTITVTPMAVTNGAQTVTVNQAADDTYKAGSVTFTVTITDSTPAPTYTVTLGDDSSTLTEESAGAGVTLPGRDALNGYAFAGWSETNVSAETTTAPTIIPVGDYAPTANITLYPVYTKTIAGGGTTHETTSVTISDYATKNSWGSSSSANQKSITINSDVTATCNSGTNSGKYYSDWRIYQTETGKVTISTTSGELTSVTFTFTISNTGTLNYNSSAITSGTAVNVSGTSAEFTVGNSGSATNGQVRITAISVNYDVTGTGTTYYWSAPVAAAVEIPSIVVKENPFLFSTTATITCETEGATIKYSFDGENWNDYSEAVTITETTTIYAKAVKGNDESSVAEVTATKNLATPNVTVSGDLTVDLNGETDVEAGTLTATVTYEDKAIEGATVTWKSSKDEIATIDEATGVVTIKTRGTVTFTATYAGNSDYAETAGTKTITVTDSKAPGSEAKPYTVAQAIDATPTSGTSDIVYIKGIVSSFYKTSIVGDGSNYRYYISDDGTTDSQLLVYKGKGLNEGTFSAAADLLIGDEVVIRGKLTTYQSASEVASGNYLVSLVRPVEISDADYATFSAPFAVDFSATGATVYTAKVNEENDAYVTLTKIEDGIVPANTGVVVYKEVDAKETLNVPATTSEATASFTDNELLVSDGTVKGDGTIYALANKNDEVGFYRVKADVIVPAGKAYLAVNNDGNVREFLAFAEGETNGIQTLSGSPLKGENIYSLSGQRVQKAQKGIYIVNGKKIMVK